MISKSSKIFVSGHRGLVGSAVLRKLKNLGYKNILTATRKKLDLVMSRPMNGTIKELSSQSLMMIPLK